MNRVSYKPQRGDSGLAWGIAPGTVWIIIALLALFSAAPLSASETLTQVTVAVPGPANISYLPIDLIPKIGADRAESIVVQLHHTGGGGMALQRMAQHQCDFAVVGLPAQMSMKSGGGDVVTLASVNDLPLFVLMVRQQLAQQVQSISDLHGRVVGVNSSSLSSKTTSQQLLELLLRHDGVPPDEVRLLPAGQSWATQAGLINSGRVDAIMGDEPFASRLLAENKVFFLANLADNSMQQAIPGAGFLHAALATRSDMLQQQDTRAERLVAALKRSLAWIASHSAAEVVAQLTIEDATERQAMVVALEKYPRLYSKDGRFSNRQLRDTERFFQEANPDIKQLVDLSSMIDSRWVGTGE
ncbi:MAG: ABC transporter substrate-binding protein [Magnetococcales bacterium]|nr:ABC transporter substrate-binding protein [Magnetococcales bacterium]